MRRSFCNEDTTTKLLKNTRLIMAILVVGTIVDDLYMNRCSLAWTSRDVEFSMRCAAVDTQLNICFRVVRTWPDSTFLPKKSTGSGCVVPTRRVFADRF